MPPLVLFDIDLTLIHTSGAGRKAMTSAFRRLWGLDDPTAGVSFEGRTDHAIFMEVIALNALADGDLEQVYRSAIEGYLEELPRSLAASESGRVLPGVIELLDALESDGVRPGLATGNLRRGAKLKLGHYGLWERFAGGGFGDDSPERADVVRQGIAELAAAVGEEPDARNAIVIGDTPLDVEASHLAGATAVAVATGSHTVEQLRASGAELVIPDLTDPARLLALIRSVSARGAASG